ncbi:glycosyltransferase family 2 protein [Sporolactobacillus shoreicorticis]|uniref:Glycosyltransferase family 2 protein n=1 Tax=Sporolactobacillus shoreicorticis TaxID=1923877 RepID=A0ABW5S455_9BACL|nr:glycosyltransferase family 2 protein [Sporolactobacillus shoreicorticis]MCO7124179.1 glycosyltransferase family 2 protein [Sporolactobacillus shoreicorticis]
MDLTVCIVTWNSQKFIRECLKCLQEQTLNDFELLIIDNASSDRTCDIIKEEYPLAKIIKNEKNLGFCGGHNLGISLSEGKFYMPLNPDVFVEKDFLENMLLTIKSKKRVGMVSGKLLRFDLEKKKKTDIIDSTGVYFKKNRRSLDRGAEEVDIGQYDKKEYVFGASGAAPLYNKQMLQDIRINGEYFLEYFFAYREDVDLAWRAQHRNWQCIYCPSAVAFHVRHNTPLKRNEMSEMVNMHSVKNRILLELQNETRYALFRDGIFFITYDLMIFIAVLLKEKTSLPAFKFIIMNFKYILQVRKQIMSRNLMDSKKMLLWFGRKKSFPIQ